MAVTIASISCLIISPLTHACHVQWRSATDLELGDSEVHEEEPGELKLERCWLACRPACWPAC